MGFKCRMNIKDNGFSKHKRTNPYTRTWKEKKRRNMNNGTIFIKLSSLRRLHQLYCIFMHIQREREQKSHNDKMEEKIMDRMKMNKKFIRKNYTSCVCIWTLGYHLILFFRTCKYQIGNSSKIVMEYVCTFKLEVLYFYSAIEIIVNLPFLTSVIDWMVGMAKLFIHGIILVYIAADMKW